MIHVIGPLPVSEELLNEFEEAVREHERLEVSRRCDDLHRERRDRAADRVDAARARLLRVPKTKIPGREGSALDRGAAGASAPAGGLSQKNGR